MAFFFRGGDRQGSWQQRLIGELTDYIVSGHSEYLFRKTIGPIRGFRRGQPPSL